MAASTWYADGGISAYDPATNRLKEEAILLASGGAVDANAITRIGYPTDPTADGTFYATGRLRITWEDWNYAKNPSLGGAASNQVTALLAVVAASEVFTSTPQTIDIMLAASASGAIYTPLVSSGAPPVNGYIDGLFRITGPSPSGWALQPNTKYWALVLPVVRHSDGSLTALHTYSNVQGRAVSFWTNRTPAAPVITSPAANQVVASGAVVNLSMAPADPDEVGPVGQYDADIAGVQVQYAERPTAGNPSPPWIDMPFTDMASSTVHDKGWWIKDAATNIPTVDGVARLALNNTVPIKCGGGVPGTGTGVLPAGAWQIRVRTFDYGHPYPAALQPLGKSRAPGAFTASDYPAINTSPWSKPVILTVSAQVPPPVPIWPVGNIAVTENVTTALQWQYRNTAIPPFAQATRSVRIRKVGASLWTDLVVGQSSASTSLIVTGFPLVSGNLYEWQVLVTDTDGKSSGWSQVARFWVVPGPGSGEIRPIPLATVDGATLGCGNNRVEVYRRGGKVRVGELTQVSYVDWSRVRDDISSSKVIVSGWDIDCGKLLAKLQAWAYEIRIIRETAFGQERVWEGPIVKLTYEADSVTIHADDVMRIAYRRIMKQAMNDSGSGDTVTSRAARVLQNAFAPDDPNVLAYLTLLSRSNDAKQYRNTPAYSRTAYEEVDDMAANAGLDYTCVGRSILLWGTKNRIGTLPEFRDKDLGSPPIVSEYGMSMANVYSISDGNGIHGEAYRLDEFGNDETYGLVEMLSSSWASDSAPDEGTYTQEGLNKVIQSFADGAERSISDRYPPPVVVRIPDNTSISADAVISIQHLVPGVVVPLRSTGTLRSVVADQKLDSIKVTQTDDEEVITMTLSPFNQDDTSQGGEEV